MTTRQNELIRDLLTTVRQDIDEIDRDLSCTYLSSTPFCVVLEDCSMGLGYQELQGMNAIEAYYALRTRPCECLRFSRTGAEEIASRWNAIINAPRVIVMGHVLFYERMRAVKVSILETFGDVAPLAE